MGALEARVSSNRLRLNYSKTQIIWLGTSQQLAELNTAAFGAAFPHSTLSTVVRDLGVILNQELTFARHIHLLSWLLLSTASASQCRSLAYSPATSTLIHSFDCCCHLRWPPLLAVFRCLDRVMRSAACFIGRIPKFGHVSSFTREFLHCLYLSSESHIG